MMYDGEMTIWMSNVDYGLMDCRMAHAYHKVITKHMKVSEAEVLTLNEGTRPFGKGVEYNVTLSIWFHLLGISLSLAP